ncbi:hypothetical protein J6590_012701 [Homalodisca vitripennis]|nr:hypothetical protein J6590_012701 [Homalodisca vitripennis]
MALISKDEGDPETPSAYRPLSRINTAGKLFEWLLQTRRVITFVTVITIFGAGFGRRRKVARAAFSCCQEGYLLRDYFRSSQGYAVDLYDC